MLVPSYPFTLFCSEDKLAFVGFCSYVMSLNDQNQVTMSTLNIEVQSARVSDSPQYNVANIRVMMRFFFLYSRIQECMHT